MDLDRVLAFFASVYEEAKPLFLSLSPKAIRHKRPNDILTDADLTLNAFFVERIQKEFPEAKIIAEESENQTLTDDWTFVVDPLDGTCNYAVGLPLCGVQIALLHDKEPVASMIGLPFAEGLYLARKGGGATCNGKPLRIDSSVPSQDGVLALSDLYDDNPEFPLSRQYEAIEALRPSFLKTRLFGAACFDFVALCSSHAIAYLCQYHLLWDIAPGLLLTKEAGAVIHNEKGGPYALGDRVLVAANNEENARLVLKAIGAKRF